jgi:hypothetical protein
MPAMPRNPVPILSYQPRQRWSRRRIAGIIIAIVLVAIIFIPLPNVTWKERMIRIDSVTGTMSTETCYFFSSISTRQVTPSPLERRLIQMNQPWTPNWTFLSHSGSDIFGSRWVACSLAPPILDLRPVLQPFADASTDDEIRAFIQVMQTGTETEQKAAVDAAATKALDHMASRTSATYD